MTTLLGWNSSILTVKHLIWLMTCRRNQISFVSLELCVSLIRRVLLVWLWRKYRLCGFQSPWTSHLGLSYRFLIFLWDLETWGVIGWQCQVKSIKDTRVVRPSVDRARPWHTLENAEGDTSGNAEGDPSVFSTSVLFLVQWSRRRSTSWSPPVFMSSTLCRLFQGDIEWEDADTRSGSRGICLVCGRRAYLSNPFTDTVVW